MLQLWNARKENIEHDFAIASWSLCFIKEVREDVPARMNGSHREAMSASSGNSTSVIRKPWML